MARSSFLFRTDPRTLAALRRWADDDLRSMNAQLEFLVRRALKEAGRLPPPPSEEDEEKGT
ncbi:MAG: Arc family DNA binding domain-containing protein [Pseudomonadota bacterium]